MEDYKQLKKDKVKYLKYWNKSIEIINQDKLNNYSLVIPEKWFNVFKEQNMNKRIEKTLNIWKQFVSKELKKTINYLEDNLLEVDFVIHNLNNNKIGYFILYTIKKDEDISYFEGNLSFDFGENNILKENWDKIPKSIDNFYKNVHNGFYYYSVPCGLDEISEVMAFNDYYCEEDFDEDEEIPKFNIKTTFGFFSNGGGDLVIIDINKNNIEDEAICWYHDDIEMSYKVNFWEEVDNWLVCLIEN